MEGLMPAKVATKGRGAKAPAREGRWIELAIEFPLRPIRSEAEYDRAIALSDRLTDQADLTDEEIDYRDSLWALIADYEDRNVAMEELTPGDYLRNLIAERGVTQGVVAEATAISDATISAIVTGRRRPSRKAMAALGAYFGVDPSSFL
jgi:HTH-type transcriptional regulator / antitoxin HigA